MSGRTRSLVLVAAIVASALAPAAARADGDPASDVLLTQSAFVPADANISGAQQTALTDYLHTAAKDHYPIRVAIIPNGYDLGSVTELWAKPRTYAAFLGIELSLVYKGPLLVVMPNGFGFNWAGHSTASAYRELEKVQIGAGGAGLLTATRTAVAALAAASGVTLPAPSSAVAAAGSAESNGGLIVIAVVLAVIAVVLAAGYRVRRRASAESHSQPTARERGSARADGAWMHWAMPGVAVLFALAVGVGIVAFSNGNHASASGDATANITTGKGEENAPVVWPEGRQPAPSFQLTDQDGQPVSLAAYRGRPVIITFIDPLCRELCPLASQVLSNVDRQLPASDRPEIIAVSVDTYGDARANLLQDYAKWHLVPEWRWAVGAPDVLKSVWKRYYAEVDVTTKHIVGVTVHYITHSEMAYVIDPNGDERALFLWPYSAHQVEQAVERVANS